MTPTDLMEQALGSPCGIAVQCSNPEALRDECYKTRRNLNGAGTKYQNLSFFLHQGELWIINTGGSQEDPLHE